MNGDHDVNPAVTAHDLTGAGIFAKLESSLIHILLSLLAVCWYMYLCLSECNPKRLVLGELQLHCHIHRPAFKCRSYTHLLLR